MDEKQKKAIDAKRSDLIEALSQPAVLPELMAILVEKDVISDDNRTILNRSELNRDKIMSLLAILKYKDQGWSALVGYLSKGFGTLANSLNIEAGITVASGGQPGAANITAVDADVLLRRQNAALQLNSKGLSAALHPDLIIPQLQMSGLITWAQSQVVNREITDEQKVMSLLHQMATNHKFYDAVIAFLTKHHSIPLRDKIEADFKKCV